MLPIYLSFVAMLDEGTHQGMATEDFNAGRAAIGTGPFRLVQHRPGDRIELERNDAWWGPQRPHWQRVSYRMITNDAARSAALLAGDVDFIDQVPTSDMARLRRDPRLRLVETTSLRTMYLVLDFAREDGSPYAFDNEGRPLRRNPLRDLRVRRALSMAIDRAAIVDRVMEGAAVATGQFLPEGSFSYVPDLPVQRYDPEGARALLREAGYPEGFRLTIHGSNDRYINDSRVVQAIGQMWTRAGVRTAVEAQPYATFITRATRREHSVSLLSWGNSTGEVSVVLNAVLGTPDREKGRGTANRGPYSNPEMDARVEAALGELDDARRERMLQEATHMAIDDLAVIPLYLQKAIWAMRRDLDYAPRADEMNSPGDVRPAAAAGR
jgi:peptide/nickel transport system substrate-binding protein